MHLSALPRAAATALLTLAYCASLAPAFAQPAPFDLTALKEQLSQDKERVPLQSIALARATLQEQQGLALEDRLWLMGHLSDDLFKAKKFTEALAIDRQGQALSRTIPRERVHFASRAIIILHEAGQDREAVHEYEQITGLLPALARSTQRKDLLAAANAWQTGGTALAALGQLPEAMDLITRALRIYDTMDEVSFEQVNSINEIALIHFKAGHFDEAMRQIERAITLATQAGQRDALSRAYLRKSHFLSSAGRVDEQYQALLAARKGAEEEHNDYNLAVIATNLADVALQKKDYAAALRYAEEAIPLVEKSKDTESMLVCQINKGLALNRLGRPGGIALIEQAIAAFSADPGKQSEAAEVQGLLAEEFAFNRDFEKAYNASLDHLRRSESVRKATDQKRITETDARYQADKRRRQIDQLEQDQRAQKRFQMLGMLAGALGLLIIIILLISRLYLKRAYSSVREMSLSDPLTGLRNRRYLASRIDEDLAQTGRQRVAHEREHGSAVPHNADVVFMMIDMDHFKRVNDEHGHGAGDALLKQFSALLLEEVRDSDTVVRWGGEEFLIVAKQSSCADVHLLAERVRARVAACEFDLGHGVVLRKTCSIGFASYPFPSPDAPRPRWEDVVALADQCLYAAKASGRDVWVGVVQQAAVAVMPSHLDVRLAVRDGLFDLQHSGERAILWPDGATH